MARDTQNREDGVEHNNHEEKNRELEKLPWRVVI